MTSGNRQEVSERLIGEERPVRGLKDEPVERMAGCVGQSERIDPSPAEDFDSMNTWRHSQRLGHMIKDGLPV